MSSWADLSEQETKETPKDRWEDQVCVNDPSPFYQKLKELQENSLWTVDEVSESTQIEMTDLDPESGLRNFCYKQNLDMNAVDLITQECRGLVYDIHGKLVARSFGYTPAYTEKNFPASVRELATEHADACQYFPSYEGTLLRAFFYQTPDDPNDGNWFLTTHRKLEAYRSFWASRTSFGAMFDQALQPLVQHIDQFKGLSGAELTNAFLASLDKSKQYLFLVRSTMESRIVSQPPAPGEPGLLYVGTFQDGYQVPNDPKVPIPCQQALAIHSIEEAFQVAEKTPPAQAQGVILFAPNGCQYKIYSSRYAKLFQLRNNVASVMFRYLQVRDNPTEYQQLYPEWKDRFQLYENVLDEIAQELLQAYINYFIHYLYVDLPEHEFKVISQAHNWYKNEKKTNPRARVTLIQIKDQLNRANPSHLNKMIRARLLLKKMSVPEDE